MEKILSIIIPSYNMEEYLDKCISSLLIRQIDKLDIIVINDGSKDRTSEIGHKYETLYPNSIRCIDKENGNYGSCINRGLSLSIGKYIKVLDADDTYLTKELESLIESLNSTNVDCIITNYQRVNLKGEVIRKFQFKDLSPKEIMSFENIWNVLANKLEMHAVVFKTSILKNINYFQSEGVSYSDVEWIFTPIAYSNTFKYIPITVYSYLFGREGQTVDPKVWRKRLNDHIIGIKKQTKLLESVHGLNTIQKSFLIKMLEKRINGIYWDALNGSKENKTLMSELDIEYNKKWLNLGLDIVRLSKIPLINKSYISDWRKHGYDNNFKIDIINKIYKVYQKIYYRLMNS